MRVVHHWNIYSYVITAAIFEGKQFGSLSCKKSLKICNPLCRCTSTRPPKNDPCETLPLFKKKTAEKTEGNSIDLWLLMKMACNDKKFWSFFKMCWKQMSRVGPLLTLKSLSQKWNTTMEHPFAVFLHEYFTL